MEGLDRTDQSAQCVLELGERGFDRRRSVMVSF